MLLLTCLYMPQTVSQIRKIFALYVWISHVYVRQYNADMLSSYLLKEHQGWIEHF